MKKKKFAVYGVVRGGKYLGVYEAENEQEAIELAVQDASVNLCHQCTSECEDAEIETMDAELVE